MTTLIPTKDIGATTKPVGVLYVEPALQMNDAVLAEQLGETGLNSAFLADLLSAVLTHERCGRHLYRSCAQRTTSPDLQAKFEEFGRETERHVEILEALITESGGNPNYVSPNARAVEGTDSKLLESTFMLAGSVDPITAELSLVDAVFIAESVDHGHWKLVAKLTEQMPEGALRDAFQAAVDEVEQQEDEHLAWATNVKEQLVIALATGETGFAIDIAAAKEELTKQELYAEATAQGIPGRSEMSKEELQEALAEATP
jgi:rubrerythrin